MSRQLSLNTYFKSKSSSSPSIIKSTKMNDEVKVTKKRSLSMRKSVTPMKSPKVAVPDKSNCEIISLCSDDDDNNSHPTSDKNITPKKEVAIESTSGCKKTASNTDLNLDDSVLELLCDIDEICHPKNDIETTRTTTDGNESDSSQNTVIYYSPQTPTKSVCTPRSTNYRSPQSGNKYFSPNKKRAVFKRISVRKDLTQLLDKCSKEKNYELFNEACIGMDDKTIFLLSIVNKCINNQALWCLLTEESQTLLSRCMHVVKPGMRLVCRLYWHKEGWYKLAKLKMILAGKETIDDPTYHEVLKSLQENGFISSDGDSLTFEDYSAILSAEELREICKDLKLKINSKQGAIAALKNFSRVKSIATFFNTNKSNDNSARVLKMMSLKVGPCYKLSDIARKSLYKLYILMYLGIDYNIIKDKNLELTLLYDKINRETYPVEEEMLDDASVVFKEKHEFESYIKAVNIYEAFLEEADSDKRIQIITDTYEAYKNTCENEMSWQVSVPEWLRRFTPLYLYTKLLEAGIQDLKKVKNYPLALEVLQTLMSQDSFRRHKKTEWYAEKALVLQKTGETEEAAKVLLEGLKSTLSEEAKDVMRPRAKIIAKNTANQEVKTELLEFANKEQILENNLRGVHMYKQPMDRTQQKGKLKFETRVSGERTIQDVEEYCLSEYLSSGEFTHAEHSGIVRDAVSWEQVRAVAGCLRGRRVAALCRRLAADYRHARAGFPDLTLWNVNTNQIRFVEVKSDTDRPSMKQIQWMHYLQQHEIDTEFCYVGVHTTRCKARPVS